MVRSTFAEFGRLLENDERFFMCNRGVIINFDYASDFDGTEFILNNGVRISAAEVLQNPQKVGSPILSLTRGDIVTEMLRPMLELAV